MNEQEEARLARIEREHSSLLLAFEALTAAREKQRSEADESMKLFKDYWDERIVGWTQRLATTDGSGDSMAALLPLLARDLVEFVNTALDKQQSHVERWVVDLFEKLLTNQSHVADKMLELHGATLVLIKAQQ